MDETHRVVGRRALLGAGLFSLVAACGTPAASQSVRPERDHLKVSVIALPDAAPLYMAVRDGMFQQAGITVELLETDKPNVTPDIYFGSWAGLFQSITEGEDLVVIGEASQATDRYCGLVVSSDSDYRSLNDRSRARIAIVELNGIGKLLTNTTVGLAGAQNELVQTSQQDMVTMLKSGKADAAWTIEPNITAMQMNHGARLLADTASGPTQAFPLSGYGCDRKFAKQNPRTIKVFQSVLAQAQEAAADATRLRDTLIDGIRVDPTVARLMTRPHYPVSLNAARLQRVADHMLTMGQLPRPLDVKTLIHV